LEWNSNYFRTKGRAPSGGEQDKIKSSDSPDLFFVITLQRMKELLQLLTHLAQLGNP